MMLSQKKIDPVDWEPVYYNFDNPERRKADPPVRNSYTPPEGDTPNPAGWTKSSSLIQLDDIHYGKRQDP